MDTLLNWRATETHVTAPFPTSDPSLENCRLRLHSGESAASDPVRYIENVNEWDRIAPELFVDVDASRLTSDTGVPADRIAMSVIVRDRDLNKFERVVAWPLDALPRDAVPLSAYLQRFSRCARLDIAVVASPRGGGSTHDASAIPDGAMLAAKTFKVRVPGTGMDLPVKFVEPATMEQEGLNSDTVCYVRWKGENVNRAARDLIEIWLNKDLEGKFRALSSRNASAAALHIGRNIEAYVYANVLAHVFASDADVEDVGEDGLVRVVGDVMEQRLGMTLDEARRIYHAGPSGQAKLMPWCWALTGADKAFATMKF